MASKNTKTKKTSVAVNKADMSVIDEIVSIEPAPEAPKKPKAAEETPAVEEKVEENTVVETETPVAEAEEAAVVAEETKEETVIDESAPEEEKVSVEEPVVPENVDKKVEEPGEPVVERKMPSRRTSRDVYGYDLCGYSYDI